MRKSIFQLYISIIANVDNGLIVHFNNIDKGVVVGPTAKTRSINEIVKSTLRLVENFLGLKRYGVVFEETTFTEQIIRDIVQQLEKKELIGDFEYIKDSIRGTTVDVCQMALGLLRLLTKTKALTSFNVLKPGILKYINKTFGTKYVVSVKGLSIYQLIEDITKVSDTTPEVKDAPVNTIANLEGELMKSGDITVGDVVLWSPLYFEIIE